MSHRSQIGRRAALALALLTVGVVASWAASAGAASGQVLRLSARAHMVLRFTTSRLHAHPGRVTIRMHNPANAGMKHGIAIEGNGVDRDGPIVAPGHTSSITVTLRRGTYEYYCPVKGHKAAGMKGTLIVS